ncbi:hypothetical protein CLU82_2880 [Flavobacterium sp. 5]|nr:hypothetical protein CLU82_2880 [Flavobacterium sp. 5]
MLCFLTLKYNPSYKIYSSINCDLWGGDENTVLFKEGITFLNSKKFKTVDLTGDNVLDKIKIEKAQNDIRKLVGSKDSVSGIKFHFGQKSEYWTIVKVLDILQIEGANLYMFYKNDIWVTNPKRLKPNEMQDIRLLLIGDVFGQEVYVKDNEINIIWQKIKLNYQATIEICKKYCLPIIAYILMLFFTIRRIINEKKGIR